MLTDTMTQDHEYIIQLNTLTDDCTRAAVPARQMFTERAFIYTRRASHFIYRWVGGSQRNYNSRDGDDDEDENDDETEEEEEALDPSRRREDPLTRVSLKARLLTSSTEHPVHRSHRRHYYYYCSQSNQSNRRVLFPLLQSSQLHRHEGNTFR